MHPLVLPLLQNHHHRQTHYFQQQVRHQEQQLHYDHVSPDR